MVRVRVSTDEGVVMEIEAEPDDLADALEVVVRIAEGRGGSASGAQQRPLLRSRLSPGQDAAEAGDPEPAYALSAS